MKHGFKDTTLSDDSQDTTTQPLEETTSIRSPTLSLQDATAKQEIETTDEERKSTICGAAYMLISAIIFSFVATLYHWGGALGYSSMQLLLFRGIIQSLLAAIAGFISCDCKRRQRGTDQELSQSPNNNIELMQLNHESVTINDDENDNDNDEYIITKIKYDINYNKKDHSYFFKMLCNYKQVKYEFVQMSKVLWFFVILRGFSGAAVSVFYIHALTLLPLGDAVTVFSLYPILTSFTAYIFLKETITLKHFISLIICIIGVILISQPSFIFNNDNNNNSHGNDRNIEGYTFALLGALTTGISFVIIRKAKKAHHLILVFSHGIVSVFVSIVAIWILKLEAFTWNGIFYNEKLKMWFVLLGNGFLGYFGQFTLSRSIQLMPAGIGSLLRSSDIIWSYIWQIWFFSVIPNGFTISGACIIIIGIVIVSLEKMKMIRKNSIT